MSETSGVVLSLAGKVALVTGGSRGIGAATVKLFRAAGAKVVFSYRSAEEQATSLVAECGGEEVCRAVKQELARPADGKTLVEAAVAAFGRLDCLIVNHGIWPAHDQPIATMTDEQWKGTISTNLDSVFGLVRAGVGAMLGQGPGIRDQGSVSPKATTEAGSSAALRNDKQNTVKGHVVLIASTAAQRGEAFHADYAASKGALISLTKSLSSELAGQGILCNCVAPGWVATEMSLAALSDPETSKKATSLIPLGRVGSVEEIAGPVLFLCTKWAGFVSGEIFNVNGGAVLVG